MKRRSVREGFMVRQAHHEGAISLNLYRLSLSPADLQVTLARQKVEAERLIRANE